MSDKIVQVHHLVKRYGNFTAVHDLSFEVYRGEVFGLLGPNGAGKTTTIRIIMDILKPDGTGVQGARKATVSIFGHPPRTVRARVGYLPEERGLYRNMMVLSVLEYLAQLKGLGRTTARQNAITWLEKVGLRDWAGRKVSELSRGMQQKLQLAASAVHDPELLILDEPFQGLDPVNVEAIKGLIHDLQRDGKTIVLSAHQMNLVEALCDRILLVNKGRGVLYGKLADIKRQYAPNSIRLRTSAALPDLAGVKQVRALGNGTYTLTLEGISSQGLLKSLVDHGLPIESYEVATAPLDEIFIAAVKGDR
ncbi:MAG: ATP-binding cassette domain-containing protein [Candidatus Methanosuratus sp.]|nr:ATP-binding cassette domain-containing protein [Candidatus Methanosuratincola sp.]